MTYKNIVYHTAEATNYKGNKQVLFYCNDKNLFEGLETKAINCQTLNILKDTIDYFINNKTKLLKIRKLNDKYINSETRQ